VPQDGAEAARLYRVAAEQGHKIAQLNLGDILATGRGIPRDVVSGYLWLALAADQGSHWAAGRRDSLARTLTTAERAEADAMIAAYKQR
jgi:TPR repeat protein